MRRWTAVLSVVGVFFVGIAAGILSTHLFYAQLLRRTGGPPVVAGRFFGHHLQDRLDLTAEQRRAIDRILERSHAEAEALRHEMRPQVMRLLDRSWKEIEELLTAAQRQELDRLRRHHRRRIEQFLLGPVGPPGRPHHHEGRFPPGPPPPP